jgi:hypothetical protein
LKDKLRIGTKRSDNLKLAIHINIDIGTTIIIAIAIIAVSLPLYNIYNTSDDLFGMELKAKRTRNCILTHPIFLAAPDAATAILELMDAIAMPLFVYIELLL